MTKGNIKKALTITSYVVDIVATIIVVIFILSFDKRPNNNNLYMVESTVIDTSKNNIVRVETVNGDIFEFKGNGSWTDTDEVILLLDDKGTEDVKDDEIINTMHNAK